MPRFTDARLAPRTPAAPLPRPRIMEIRHPISSGTAFSLATDAEHYRDSKSAAEWFDLAEVLDREANQLEAERSAAVEREAEKLRSVEREQMLRHVRRYGL